MAILILWDLPVGTLSVARYAVVERALGEQAFQVLEDRACWGFHQDHEVSSIDDARYKVSFRDSQDRSVILVPDEDLFVYAQPPDVGVVTVTVRDAFGRPAEAASLQISDEPSAATFWRTIYTNPRGKLAFPLRFGARVLLRPSWLQYALDAVMPNVPDATWEHLVANGSWVRKDMRSLR